MFTKVAYHNIYKKRKILKSALLTICSPTSPFKPTTDLPSLMAGNSMVIFAQTSQKFKRSKTWLLSVNARLVFRKRVVWAGEIFRFGFTEISPTKWNCCSSLGASRGVHLLFHENNFRKPGSPFTHSHCNYMSHRNSQLIRLHQERKYTIYKEPPILALNHYL